MELFSRTVCLDVGPNYVVKPCSNYTVGPPDFNITFPIFPTSPLPTTIATATTPDIRTSTLTGTRGPSPEITTTPSPGIPTGTGTRGPPPEETATPSITPQFTPTLPGTPPKNIGFIIGLVIGLVIGIMILLVLIAVLLYCWRKRHHPVGKTSPSSTSPDPIIEDDGKSRFSFSGALSSAAGLCACLNISEKEEDHQLYAPDAYAENSSSSADGRGITNNASDHHSKETRLNGGKTPHHGDDAKDDHENNKVYDDPNQSEEDDDGAETTHL